MTALMDTRPTEDLGPDDMLLPVSHTEWVATNVFCATVPLLRTKLLFELTCVDIPRTRRRDVEAAITRIVESLNQSPRLFLRLDHGQNCPTELFADVVYLADGDTSGSGTAPQHSPLTSQWCSLQETLLRHGVALLARPSAIRQRSLLLAEKEGASEGSHCCWLRQAVTREQSATFNAAARCRVVDVVRGDVFVVEWLPTSSSCSTASLWPCLLVLDAVVCLPVGTATGRRALHWSQRHVLHTTLAVTVHSREPLDKDVSLSTQLESLEQLGCVRGTALFDSSGDDVAVALIRTGTASVRCLTAANCPRPSNFHALLEAAEEQFVATCTRASASPTDSARTVCILKRLWSLPRKHVAALMAFHGPLWEQEVRQHCAVELGTARRSQTRSDRDTLARPPSLGLTARLWSQCVWCGSVLSDASVQREVVFLERPLRSLCSLQTLVKARNAPHHGHVRNVSLVSATHGSARCLYMQVDVELVAPASQWTAVREAGGIGSATLLQFDPPPRPEPYLVNRPLEVYIECDTGLLPSQTEDAFIMVEVTGKSVTRGDAADAEVSVSRTVVHAHRAVITLPVPAGAADGCEYIVAVKYGGSSGDGTAPPLAEQTAHYWLRAAVWMSEANEPTLVEGAAEALLELADEQGGRGAEAGGGADGDQASALSSLSDESDDDDNAAKPSTTEEGDNTAAGMAMDGRADGHECETATPGVTEPSYLARVLLFFSLPPALTLDDFASHHDEAKHHGAAAEAVRQLAADLLHREVRASFAAKATVNGVRGLLGDLGFSPASAATPPLPAAGLPPNTSSAPQDANGFTHSLLDLLGSAPLCGERADTPLHLWPSSETIRAALSAGAHGSQEGAHTNLGHVVVGDTPLWQDHDDDDDDESLPCLCRRTFTPLVSLACFSLRPRQLFCGTTNDQHRIVEKEQRAGEDDSVQNIDWATMRLPFRRLPNVMNANLELLPPALRNIERAYCHRHFGCLTSEEAPSTTPPANDTLPPLHGEESSTARVLALLLLLLRDEKENLASESGHCNTGALQETDTTSAYQLLTQHHHETEAALKSTLSTEVVLYLSLPTAASPACGRRGKEMTWFLGNRDVPSSDLFEDSDEPGNLAPETLPYSLPQRDRRRVIAAVGREMLTESVRRGTPDSLQLTSERLCDEVWPLTYKGLDPVPSRAHTRRLYHPAPDVHILGFPLAVHDEVASDHLASLMSRGSEVSGQSASPHQATLKTQRQRVGVEYVPVYVAKKGKPHAIFSYGRIGRSALADLQRLRASFGGDAMTYMTLLLRQSVRRNRSASPLADGQLFVYGVTAEALYAHYRSRRDLRFSLGIGVPLLRPVACAKPHGEQRVSSESEAAVGADEEVDFERKLLSGLCAYLRHILGLITQKLIDQNVCVSRVFLQWVAHIHQQQPYIAVLVYPVDNAETIAKLGTTRAEPVDAYGGNPHRPFSTGYGVVRHRLPLGELRIVRRGAEPSIKDFGFDAEWLARLEQEEEPSP